MCDAAGYYEWWTGVYTKKTKARRRCAVCSRLLADGDRFIARKGTSDRLAREARWNDMKMNRRQGGTRWQFMHEDCAYDDVDISDSMPDDMKVDSPGGFNRPHKIRSNYGLVGTVEQSSVKGRMRANAYLIAAAPAMLNALRVLTLTPQTRSWLTKHDPKALEQADAAVELAVDAPEFAQFKNRS